MSQRYSSQADRPSATPLKGRAPTGWRTHSYRFFTNEYWVELAPRLRLKPETEDKPQNYAECAASPIQPELLQPHTLHLANPLARQSPLSSCIVDCSLHDLVYMLPKTRLDLGQ